MQIAISWDDGLVSDFPLMKILEKYSAPASFSLCFDYHDVNKLNDHRYHKYGERVRKSDLIVYNDYDICNHTFSHTQLDAISYDEACLDIKRGKDGLENLFERQIDGIVYPYGLATDALREFARKIGHTYGRTTPSINKTPTASLWDLVPNGTWQSDLDLILAANPKFILLSGHSYELKTKRHWDLIDELYCTLATSSEFELVTMSELAKRIQYASA
jgi:hypothetical protein